MDRLEGRIQNYAWGSRSAIAEVLGSPRPAPQPEAELWLGAHLAAPSRVLRDGTWRSLSDVVAAHPEAELGTAVVRKFGESLPFLLKLLAAEQPLSLQAHPNRDQAARGFAADDAAGIARDAPTRRYRDSNHKPELFCALAPSDALCGFRPVVDTRRLLRAIESPALRRLDSALEDSDESRALRSALAHLLGLDRADRARLVPEVLDGIARRGRSGVEFEPELDWVLRLGELYPEDVGVVVALLLNLVKLAPGDAIYLPAGNLHAYLRGFGVEIMANSDNVLRGGLTPKHVDASELVSILDFRAIMPEPLRPEPAGCGEAAYATPAHEFRLSRVDLEPTAPFRGATKGAEILFCLEGSLIACPEIGPSLELVRGQAAFVRAASQSYELRGSGTVFRAAVGSLA
jgi:mannose-6-phosphate isomerase